MENLHAARVFAPMTARIGAPHPGPRAPGAPSALRSPVRAPAPGAALGLPGSAGPSPGKQTRTGELQATFADPLAAGDPPTGHVVAGADATSAARKRYVMQLEQMFGRPERGR